MRGKGGWLPHAMISHLSPIPQGMSSSLSFSIERYPELAGHFPQQNVLPAVYTLEGMYQTAIAYLLHDIPTRTTGNQDQQQCVKDTSSYPPIAYPSLLNARFTKTAEIPCELKASVLLTSKQMGGPWEFEGQMIDNNGEPTASASFVLHLLKEKEEGEGGN